VASLDAIYTPAWIAMDVAEALPDWPEGTAPHIADLAAGEGALLADAEKLWPEAEISATDASPKAVRALRRDHPHWLVGCCDVLNSRSLGSSLHAGCHYDAVLLNPPFTSRGAHTVAADGADVRCSPAMAFVIEGLRRLAPSGVLVAVLPVSCLTSIKDEAVRAYIASRHNVEVLRFYSRNAFPGAYASTALVRLTPHSSERSGVDGWSPRTPVVDARPSRPCLPKVGIRRGWVQMHNIPSGRGRVPLVHSTSLQGGRVQRFAGSAPRDSRSLHGPMILLPRVGTPRQDKLVWRNAAQPIALSDCVFALTAEDSAAGEALWIQLREEWEQLEARYSGSCAKYLTKPDLIQHLVTIGVEVSPT
jgi:predicted RNA methylase